MALNLPLDHILLPKALTDDFYTTWNNYYVELFPSPVKPKYRPLSKILTCDEDHLTKSSPDILSIGASSQINVLDMTIPNKTRVGDNIDEFISNYRRSMYRSNSTNNLLDDFEKQKSLQYFNVETFEELYTVKQRFKRSKSDVSEMSIQTRTKKKQNRFSWCGAQTCKFLSNLPGRKKVYECMDAETQYENQENIPNL